MEASKVENPVRSPPGRPKSCTKPEPFGSATSTKTMGMPLFLIAAVAGVDRLTTRSGRIATISLAATLGQTVFERGGLRLSAGIAWRESTHQHRDAPFPLWPLCSRCERPCGDHSAGERDELAPPHSVTSSAATSSLSGTVRPSILAVSALINSSNLLACTTGKSAGLAPLRMRPV